MNLFAIPEVSSLRTKIAVRNTKTKTSIFFSLHILHVIFYNRVVQNCLPPCLSKKFSPTYFLANCFNWQYFEITRLSLRCRLFKVNQVLLWYEINLLVRAIRGYNRCICILPHRDLKHRPLNVRISNSSV